MITRVVIRHLSGAKANQVEQFKLDDLNELMIGRSAAATINFEGPLHDGVSRRHGCIRVSRARGLGFTIIDLGSSNGIWVNGHPVLDETRLSPDDVVELGIGGPSFRFDVQPSPYHLADPPASGRQHEATLGGAVEPGTSNSGTLDLVASYRTTAGEYVPDSSGALPQGSVPKSVSTLGFAIGVFLAALVGMGAGALVYRQRPIPDAPLAGQLTPDPAPTHLAHTDPVQPRSVQPAVVPSPIVMTTQQIAQKLAGSIVSIKVQWRLYDRSSGSPVFQRMLTRRGVRLPCFVTLADGQVVPWLSTDDEDHTNSPIASEVDGSGVVVGQQGAILTSRHVAAAWTTPYDLRAGSRVGVLFQQQESVGRSPESRPIDLYASGVDGERLASWLPSRGAVLFRSRYPVAIGPSRNNLEGRNDTIDIRLKPDQASTAGRLVRLSDGADMAELKIDTDRSLTAAEPASGDLKIGDTVTILGYPADAVQANDASRHSDDVRQLVVIPGTVTVRTGNAYRLSVSGISASSGSPVFDSRGRLVALAEPHTPVGADGLDVGPIRFSRPLLQ